MAKENPLNAGLKAHNKRKGKKRTPLPKSADTGYRANTVLVAGHFSQEVQRGLRIIAAEEDLTLQALLAEGINMVFAKRGRPEIAASTNAPAADPVEEQEVTA